MELSYQQIERIKQAKKATFRPNGKCNQLLELGKLSKSQRFKLRKIASGIAYEIPRKAKRNRQTKKVRSSRINTSGDVECPLLR